MALAIDHDQLSVITRGGRERPGVPRWKKRVRAAVKNQTGRSRRGDRRGGASILQSHARELVGSPKGLVDGDLGHEPTRGDSANMIRHGLQRRRESRNHDNRSNSSVYGGQLECDSSSVGGAINTEPVGKKPSLFEVVDQRYEVTSLDDPIGEPVASRLAVAAKIDQDGPKTIS